MLTFMIEYDCIEMLSIFVENVICYYEMKLWFLLYNRFFGTVFKITH